MATPTTSAPTRRFPFRHGATATMTTSRSSQASARKFLPSVIAAPTEVG